MTLLSRRLDSSTFFVPDPTRTRQPMHLLARVFLTLECISLRVRQSDIFCCFRRGGRFRTAAVAAAVADVRHDCTSDVTTVTPNATGFPVRHGKRISPSGRLPSVRVRPDGSIIAGISAEEKARETTSLRAWCRLNRPGACVHSLRKRYCHYYCYKFIITTTSVGYQ